MSRSGNGMTLSFILNWHLIYLHVAKNFLIRIKNQNRNFLLYCLWQDVWIVAGIFYMARCQDDFEPTWKKCLFSSVGNYYLIISTFINFSFLHRRICAGLFKIQKNMLELPAIFYNKWPCSIIKLSLNTQQKQKFPPLSECFHCSS